MGDMADDLMDRLDNYECDEWCDGCPHCALDTQWVTMEGQVIDIKKLETKHLTNILNYVVRGKKQSSVGMIRWKNLCMEAKKRGIYRDPKRGNRFNWPKEGA